MRHNVWLKRAVFPLAALCATVALAQPTDPVGAQYADGYPWIWVRFDNRTNDNPPQEGLDFDFVFTDPNAPSVILRRGENSQLYPPLHEWRVWATIDDDSDPPYEAPPADLGTVSSPGSYNYSVRVLGPIYDEPGAANLGSMLLMPEDDHFADVTGYDLLDALPYYWESQWEPHRQREFE